MTIAYRIKQLRQEKEWTQAELAERIGIKQKQISAYERGINSPSTDVLIKLAEVFHVTLDYLALATKRANGKAQHSGQRAAPKIYTTRCNDGQRQRFSQRNP